MKKLVVLLVVLMLGCSAIPAHSQTTYTVTADGCGGKNLGYCRLNVVDQNSQPFVVVLDNRYNAQGQINTLQVTDTTNSYPPLLSVHGVYTRFVGNPNGTHAAYYGSGAFVSDDSTVEGTFQFYAYYVATCSGRACAGTTVGWHFRVLLGSTVTVQ